MKFSWMAAGLVCVALAGCHKSDTGAQNPSASPDSTVATDSNSPAAATAATSNDTPPSGMPDANPAAAMATQGSQATPADFVRNAAFGDMFEIASSKIALRRAQNPAVKDFARMMIRDHTRTTAALKAAIAKSGEDFGLPPQLPADKLAMLQTLTNAPAAGFDKAYMDAQVNGHQDVLDLMSRYANDGTIPDLKDFASKTGQLVQTHLDKAKAVRQQLG